MLCKLVGLAGATLLACSLALNAKAAEAFATWPQFRGPGGRALGSVEASFPTRFGPSEALGWKTALPVGHGSPCIWGDRIFVTAFEPATKTLELIALERRNGDIVWRRKIEAAEIEEVHAVSSPANSTPTTDGEHIYVYFGSVGLLAFDWDGKQLWRHDMGVSEARFGSGASPIIAGDLVVIHRDYPKEPYLLAVNRFDGKQAWKATLEFDSEGRGPRTSHATPVLWKDQVVLYRPGKLSAHRLADGEQVWWAAVGGAAANTPVVSGERIFLAAYSNLGSPENFVEPRPFPEALAMYDKDGDGMLSRDECPAAGLFFVKRPGVADSVPGAHFGFKQFFGFVDQDKDGLADEEEYYGIYRRVKEMAPRSSGLTAVRPDGEGDITLSALEWKERRGAPEVPSPVVYDGRLYAVTNGGILTCVDAASGKIVYRGRINAPGAYYASPVAAGGRLVVASSEGVVTVLEGGEKLEVLANNDLGEPIFGTPAPVGDTLYVRSLHHLWAFGATAFQQTAGIRGRP